MDYENLEQLAKDPNNTLMILCSPHNPVGRVWKKLELFQALEICYNNGVMVFCDEDSRRSHQARATVLYLRKIS